MYIDRWVRALPPVTARVKEQTAASLIEHTHARHSRTRSRAELLTQCLIKANQYIATEQSWDAPVTATTPAMAKTAIGKTNLSDALLTWPFFFDTEMLRDAADAHKRDKDDGETK